jgi:hypothetical protein
VIRLGLGRVVRPIERDLGAVVHQAIEHVSDLSREEQLPRGHGTLRGIAVSLREVACDRAEVGVSDVASQQTDQLKG